MTSVSRHERISGQLVDLKMPGALEALDEVIRRVDSGSLSGSEAIEHLLGAQIALRNDRRLEAAMRSSRLPAVKRLADFDFTFQPSLRREQIDSLHELDFLRRKENVVFLGPPGVGKTHLAISLAIRAAESGRRVYYGSLRDLVGSLQEAETKGQLRRRLRVLTHPALLVVDEIGYLPVTRNGATLFFQLINERYERASTVLTSNKGFEEWGTILGDEVMAAALLDRLLHHCHIVNIRGNSYRMRQRGDLLDRLLHHCHIVNIRGNSYRMRQRGDLTSRAGAPAGPGEKEPRTRASYPSGGAPVKRYARRARISGRSAPSVRARRAHPGTHPPPPIRQKALQIPSTHPSAGTRSPRKSGTFSKPKSGTFSKPIDTARGALQKGCVDCG